MKVLYIALIASSLMACNSSSNDKSTPNPTVGGLAVQLIENQTTDDGEPYNINAVNFREEEDVYEFIEVSY